jgi:pimeloyl-ACP methyl ester carboxylesterase
MHTKRNLYLLTGAIVTDICAHLGHETIAGAVLLAAIPALGGELMKVINTENSSVTDGLQSLDDVAVAKRDRFTFGERFFFRPEDIPFEVKMLWTGYWILQPPITTRLCLHRKQNEEALYRAGREGLKVLCLRGLQDVLILDTAKVLKPLIKNLDVVEIDQAGHAPFYEQAEETNRALLEFARKTKC